jgi:DnaJ domain
MIMQFETMRHRGNREIPTREGRRCDWPGCPAEGEHRAPRSRRELKQFWWFCLAHVRQYNASWNYYAGMTEQEIEADVRFDTVWQRPSWRMGENVRAFAFGSVGDAFAIFGNAAEAQQRPATPEEQAMVVLDLEPPVTVAIVKARYKTLVKRYHPDANGGDKAAEERFKDISAAYRVVLKSLGE